MPRRRRAADDTDSEYVPEPESVAPEKEFAAPGGAPMQPPPAMMTPANSVIEISDDDDDDDDGKPVAEVKRKRDSEHEGEVGRPKKTMRKYEEPTCPVKVKNPEGGTIILHPKENIVKARSPKLLQLSRQQKTLGNLQPQTVDRYLHLMETNEIPADLEEGDLTAYDKLKPTIELYLLSNVLRDAMSTNIIVDNLAQMLDSGTFSLDAVKFVYEKTKEGAPLRRLFVDYAALVMNGNRVEAMVNIDLKKEPEKKLPKEFITDVLVCMSRRLDATGSHAKTLSTFPTEGYHSKY